MRLVQDAIFAEEVSFRLPNAVARRCTATTTTMEEAFRQALEYMGFELLDYDSCHFQSIPLTDETHVVGHSRHWRERMMR